MGRHKDVFRNMREEKILELFNIEGKNCAEIAREIGYSTSSVSRTIRKLGITSEQIKKRRNETTAWIGKMYGQKKLENKAKEMLDDLKRLHKALDRPPVKADIEELGKYTFNMYIYRFKSIKKARRLAGIPEPTKLIRRK